MLQAMIESTSAYNIGSEVAHQDSIKVAILQSPRDYGDPLTYWGLTIGTAQSYPSNRTATTR